MRQLTDAQVVQVLTRCGVNMPDDAEAETWSRVSSAIRLAYKLGLDAETIKIVHKEVQNEQGKQ